MRQAAKDRSEYLLSSRGICLSCIVLPGFDYPRKTTFSSFHLPTVHPLPLLLLTILIAVYGFSPTSLNNLKTVCMCVCARAHMCAHTCEHLCAHLGKHTHAESRSQCQVPLLLSTLFLTICLFLFDVHWCFAYTCL